jgi:hypothetical protein
MAHICPLLYVPRVHWPEQVYLEALLADGGGTAPAGASLSEREFLEGRWTEPLLTQAASLRQGMQAWVDQRGSKDTDNGTDSLLLRSSRVVLGEGVLKDGYSANEDDAPASSVAVVTDMVVVEFALAMGGSAFK